MCVHLRNGNRLKNQLTVKKTQTTGTFLLNKFNFVLLDFEASLLHSFLCYQEALGFFACLLADILVSVLYPIFLWMIWFLELLHLSLLNVALIRSLSF